MTALGALLIGVCLILGAFAYRVRGGGFVDLGRTTYCRIIWMAALSLIWLLEASPQLRWQAWPPLNWYYLAWLPVGAFISLIIPHAFCQNSGTWPVPQNRWPGDVWPNPWRSVTDQEWAALPMWKRRAHDFAEMAGVASLRAVVVFTPYIILGGFASHWSLAYEIAPGVTAEPLTRFLVRGVVTMLIMTLLQPAGYLLGWLMPVTLCSSVRARTTEWGEVFNGAAWAIAMLCL